MIATGTLPSKSAEFGHDEDVVRAVAALFPDPPAIHRNARGGMAVFLQEPTVQSLQGTLDRMGGVPDASRPTPWTGS